MQADYQRYGTTPAVNAITNETKQVQLVKLALTNRVPKTVNVQQC